MTARRRIPRIIGGLVGLLGLAFVVRLVWRFREDLVDTLSRAQPAWLLVALVVGVCGMSVIGLAWRRLVQQMGGDIDRASALRAYFVGQLGKYVPGGVWAVVGRGEWARREGVAGTVAYASTMLSMITAYVAASLVAGIALVVDGGALDGANPWLVAGVVALGPLGLLGLHPRLLGWGADLARRVSHRELQLEVLPWPQALGVVARQLLAWIGIGGATWLVTVGLGADLSFVRVLLATCVSWVAGFLFLPVPGGIGIREAAFVGVLGQDPIVATVALAARLLFIVVDVTGAGSATLAASRTRTLP